MPSLSVLIEQLWRAYIMALARGSSQKTHHETRSGTNLGELKFGRFQHYNFNGISVCTLEECLRTRTSFPKIMHCPSMIRILGTVKYHSQKKTFYKWQPRVGDSTQGGLNTHLNDFDHKSFTRIPHSTLTATAG